MKTKISVKQFAQKKVIDLIYFFPNTFDISKIF